MKKPLSFTTPVVPASVRVLTICCAALLAGCSGGSSGGDDAGFDAIATETLTTGDNPAGNDQDTADASQGLTGACSVANINQWVDERMRDEYIYYDQVPQLNLNDYDDPARLVRDLRVLPDIYSSLVDQAQDEQIVAGSNVTRFGFRVQRASDDTFRFSDISGNSPMEAAGIQRGDELVAINSVDYSVLTDEQWLEFIVGESDQELTATFTVQSTGAAARDVTVTKTSYTETTVPVFGTYPATDNRVAYMKVDSFRATTEEEIDNAMRLFAEQGVSDLILDLRYNGGGFTRVARKLASQIAGQAFVGEAYSRRILNDKFSQFNGLEVIEEAPFSLGLSRLFVLTTGETASASETLINGLTPMIDVVVVGQTTVGKPFSSIAQDFCGLRLHAMSALNTNGVNVSVLGGIAPTCTVFDDYLAPADNLNDALTGAAFQFMQTGVCVTDVEIANSKSLLTDTRKIQSIETSRAKVY